MLQLGALGRIRLNNGKNDLWIGKCQGGEFESQCDEVPRRLFVAPWAVQGRQARTQAAHPYASSLHYTGQATGTMQKYPT